MKLLLTLLAAAALNAQTGNYHFVELSIRGTGAALEVRNSGGSVSGLRLPGPTATADALLYTGTLGAGAAAAETGTWNGNYTAEIITTPLGGTKLLSFRQNEGGSLLAASLVDGTNFDLFFAIKAGDAPIHPRGDFAGAYFAVNNGQVTGLTSALVEFTADGVGNFTNVLLNGHTSARDDVNREERPASVTYSIDSSGRGVARFPRESDLIAGDRDFLLSADGNWMVGFGRGAGQRDIFIARRRDADRSPALLQGLYWISELTAETPFAFDPNAVRFSSATGSLRADGQARMDISQQVARQGAAATNITWMTTSNAYYADSTGRAAMVPLLSSDRRRSNFHFSFDGLLGAQVGPPGEVTLEHGLWVGVQASSREAFPAVAPHISPNGIVNAATFTLGPAAPLAYLSLFGVGLANTTATSTGTPLPLDLAGTRVLVNGQPAPLSLVSPGQVNMQWPANVPAGSSIQVSTAAGVSNALTLPVATASPGVFPGAIVHADYRPVNGSFPARPGEVIIVFAGGLGPVNPTVDPGAAAPANPLSRTSDANLRVAIGGQPAIVEFSGLAPGFSGLYQLNVRVPEDAPATQAAPVAIALSGAFTDMAEIAIAP